MHTVSRYRHGKTFIIFNKDTMKIVPNNKGNYKLFRSEEEAQAEANKLNQAR